jgi:hypothetical protein
VIKEVPKMIKAITSATQAQPVAQPPVVSQKSPQSKSQQPSTTDTVQLSSAGKAALEEATETRAETVKEARNGDTQAKKLLAREEAAKAVKS